MKIIIRVTVILAILAVSAIFSGVLKEYLKKNVFTEAAPSTRTVEHVVSNKTVPDENILKRVVKQQAANLPMLVNKDMEVSQIFYLSGQLHTSYRLLNTENPTDKQKEKFINEIKPQLQETSCNNPGTEIFRQIKNYSMHYRYNDKNGKHITTIVIDEKKCNKG